VKKLRAIPQIPVSVDSQTRAVLAALKENIETMSGQRGQAIAKLDSSATLADVISKINEIIG